MRDENIFSLNLQSRHTKSVKSYNAEVYTDTWKNADVEVLKGGYRAKSHDPLLQHLRNSWIRVSSAIWPEELCVIWLRLMVPQGVCDREREGERDIEIWRQVWNP